MAIYAQLFGLAHENRNILSFGVPGTVTQIKINNDPY